MGPDTGTPGRPGPRAEPAGHDGGEAAGAATAGAPTTAAPTAGAARRSSPGTGGGAPAAHASGDASAADAPALAVLSFPSTHAAMAAEDALRDSGFRLQVIPLPFWIAAGCGLAIRLAATAAAPALAELARRGIRAHGPHHENTDGHEGTGGHGPARAADAGGREDVPGTAGARTVPRRPSERGDRP